LGVLDRFAGRGQFRTEAQKILTRPREKIVADGAKVPI
jgi:hypothetical protein